MIQRVLHKTVLLSFACVTLFGADTTLQRVDTMVEDIISMRKSYEREITIEQEKNLSLKKELQAALEKNKSLKNQISSLKNQINREKKEYIRKDLCLDSYKDSDNIFPKLKTSIQKSQLKKITYFKAAPFRLKNDAKIYDNFENPNYLMTWEAGRSFTSNQKSDKWIKITGYFVDRVWQPAKESLWVHQEDVIKRESK